MGKESLLFTPRDAVRQARKQHGLTQRTLAAACHLSVPTIHNLEQGRGRLASWWRALGTLNLELAGRNFPPGQDISQRIASLRKRQQMSQRALAELVQVSRPTITALETTDRGRVETLLRVLAVLGAGAYLAPKGQTQNFFTHTGNTSTHHGWHTPPEIMHGLYVVFGTFDLDPCSSTRNRRRAPVRARTYFTLDDDGLRLPWHGRVFVNPPYGRSVPRWVGKARTEVQHGRAQVVVALVAARTDTRWWHDHIAGVAEVFLLRGRLRFGDGKQAAPFPSALVVWGADSETVTQLQTVFPLAWYVPALPNS